MIGKPTQVDSMSSGIEASLEALANRIGELHEQLTYLQEHAAFVSMPTEVNESVKSPVTNLQPAKSLVRAKIDELAEGVEIATTRVLHVRCHLDQ